MGNASKGGIQDAPTSFWISSKKVIWTILKYTPFREVILAVILLSVVKENYPFSHFPMYSSLSPSANYVYVTNGKDEVLGFKQTFALSAPQTSKVLRSKRREAERKNRKDWTEIRQAEASRIAGEEILTYLIDTAPAEKRDVLRANGLKLYEVKLRQNEEGIHEDRSLVAELKPRANP